MKRELRDQRNRAAERHDSALVRYPTREGEVFAGELRQVVQELAAVIDLADEPSSDPVEVAKTYRWLGDAYFDLGRGKDQEALTRGSQAYQRCDELLTDADSPVEKAKLDFNYGNTLRGLSQGFDVGLLEAAQTRYESAAQTFRIYHLPDLAVTVEQQLRSIDPQLRLARKNSDMERGYGKLEHLKENLQTGDPVERERIAKELADPKKVPNRGDVGDALDDALGAIREQYEQHPERFNAEAVNKLDVLPDQMGALADVLKETERRPEPAGETEESEQHIIRVLTERLQQEAEMGRVSGDRAGYLGDLLRQFTEVMSHGEDDLDSIAKQSQKMRELTQQVMDMALTPSWGGPTPEPGSWQERAVGIVDGLKRHLTAEKGRAMLPSEEASAGTDLLIRLSKLELRVRESAGSDAVAADLEGELWRLAIEVQEHARRHHLMIARPIFATAKIRAKPKSLFLSGGEELVNAAQTLAERENLQLFERAARGDRAQERWNQLSSASVAAFDLGAPKGADCAQVCYELGLALALGKPSIVAARQRQKIPFNVNLQPIRLRCDTRADADTLDEAIQVALGAIVWGGGEAGVGEGPREALAFLRRRFPERMMEGAVRIAADLADSKREDAVAFRGSLKQLLGMLGADAPEALLPAWPPAYPGPDDRPRCFHVMPFRPAWSKPTRDLAEQICRAGGWTYMRGDETEEQRVIRGIWTEISRASAVLIDVTGHNPNVALELGLAHALGRPFRVIAQGDPEEHMFPSLEKIQIHRYGRGPRYSGLAETVKDLLRSAEA